MVVCWDCGTLRDPLKMNGMRRCRPCVMIRNAKAVVRRMRKFKHYGDDTLTQKVGDMMAVFFETNERALPKLSKAVGMPVNFAMAVVTNLKGSGFFTPEHGYLFTDDMMNGDDATRDITSTLWLMCGAGVLHRDEKDDTFRVVEMDNEATS